MNVKVALLKTTQYGVRLSLWASGAQTDKSAVLDHLDVELLVHPQLLDVAQSGRELHLCLTDLEVACPCDTTLDTWHNMD